VLQTMEINGQGFKSWESQLNAGHIKRQLFIENNFSSMVDHNLINKSLEIYGKLI